MFGGTTTTPGATSVVLPSVMLSPKAMNFVFWSCGIGLTTTLNVQLPFCWRESVASQVTAGGPMGNGVPESGAHLTVTGCDPFAAIGVSNATVGFWPLCERTSISVGQLTTGSSMTGLG